jgi:uncharacterized protein YecT (DUF1311 family)
VKRLSHCVAIKSGADAVFRAALALATSLALAACQPATQASANLDASAPTTIAATTATAPSLAAAPATQAQDTQPAAAAERAAAPAAAALRASFKACIDAAGGVDAAMQACIGEEYGYQDTRLNAAYGALRKSLPAQRMASLRTEQRGWIAERDRNCAWDAKTEGSAQRLQANYCQMETTAKRADALEAMLRGSGAAAADTQIEANAAPDGAGRIALTAGDLKFQLTAPSCRPVSDALSVCDKNVELVVTRADGVSQTLRPATLYLNARGTLYRGPSARRDRSKSQSIIVADVNGDGRDDLALWTGVRGGYGAASYDIHLFDATRKTFVRSAAFSELTVGKDGFFTVSDGRIRATSKSGCCRHTEEFYVVEKNAPKLVERIVEDAASGRVAPKRVVSKLIDGQMREVNE